jgi:hypothetical protein
VDKELELSCQLNIQPLGRCLPNQVPDNVVVAVVLCSSSSELEGEHKAKH